MPVELLEKPIVIKDGQVKLDNPSPQNKITIEDHIKINSDRSVSLHFRYLIHGTGFSGAYNDLEQALDHVKYLQDRGALNGHRIYREDWLLPVGKSNGIAVINPKVY